MRPLRFVIVDLKTFLAWSNETGWGDLVEATRFTAAETERVNLPMGKAPCFMSNAVAERYIREGKVDNL